MDPQRAAGSREDVRVTVSTAPFTLDELDRAADLVHAAVPPTPAHRWPQLAGQLDADVVVKHENHTPVGAFKVRGGIATMASAVGGDDVVAASAGKRGASSRSICTTALETFGGGVNAWGGSSKAIRGVARHWASSESRP